MWRQGKNDENVMWERDCEKHHLLLIIFFTSIQSTGFHPGTFEHVCHYTSGKHLRHFGFLPPSSWQPVVLARCRKASWATNDKMKKARDEVAPWTFPQYNLMPRCCLMRGSLDAGSNWRKRLETASHWGMKKHLGFLQNLFERSCH